MELTRDQALEILWDDNEDYETIEDSMIEHSRWSVHHELVVKHIPTGKFYLSYYSVGATESQDESPWEYDNSVKFLECEKVEVVSHEWKVKK